MNYGYQNEKDFVELFDKKYLHEMDNNSQLFLKDLFGDILDNTERLDVGKIKLIKRLISLSNTRII